MVTGSTPPALAARLRLEVGRFRAAERRRDVPFSLHVGTLAGERHTATADGGRGTRVDASLRLDLAHALAARLADDRDPDDPPVEAWLTRRGLPALHDEDLRWYAAARAACAAYAVPLAGFWALTPSGWLDVLSGDSRTWRRLRLRE